ncbi:MAG: hypothetical protein BWY78_00554 [Alphaproteobacteria bacterium ADurb.Bin438]|nr:MAG: hypothetical protein BWY78_00554 [Alphaproteobacteria bacterium ADurb.Bin438]
MLKNKTLIYTSLLLLISGIVIAAITSVPDAYKNAVKRCESGGRYNIMGGAGNSYAGAYQFSNSHVNTCLAGVCKQFGVTNKQQFLNSPAAQDAYFEQYVLAQANSLGQSKCGGNRYPTLSSYIGKTYPGSNVKITEWGLVMGSHLLGPCGLERTMQDIMAGKIGATDAFNTPGGKYVLVGSALDLNTTGPNPSGGSCGDIKSSGFLTGSGTNFGPGSSGGSSGTGGGNYSTEPEKNRFQVENLPWYTGGDDTLTDKRYNELFKLDDSCEKE